MEKYSVEECNKNIKEYQEDISKVNNEHDLPETETYLFVLNNRVKIWKNRLNKMAVIS